MKSLIMGQPMSQQVLLSKEQLIQLIRQAYREGHVDARGRPQSSVTESFKDSASFKNLEALL